MLCFLGWWRWLFRQPSGAWEASSQESEGLGFWQSPDSLPGWVGPTLQQGMKIPPWEGLYHMHVQCPTCACQRAGAPSRNYYRDTKEACLCSTARIPPSTQEETPSIGICQFLWALFLTWNTVIRYTFQPADSGSLRVAHSCRSWPTVTSLEGSGRTSAFRFTPRNRNGRWDSRISRAGCCPSRRCCFFNIWLNSGGPVGFFLWDS